MRLLVRCKRALIFLSFLVPELYRIIGIVAPCMAGALLLAKEEVQLAFRDWLGLEGSPS
jgi:hypothetical protein